MKMTPLLMAVALIAALLIPAATAAAEDQMTYDEACKILGNCSDDAVAVAEQMRAQCAKMMETANKMMAQAMQIKTRGQMWGDNDMVTEGDALLARGRTMLEQAKKMDEQCKIIIDEATAAKKKSSGMAEQKQQKAPNPPGDHIPTE